MSAAAGEKEKGNNGGARTEVERGFPKHGSTTLTARKNELETLTRGAGKTCPSHRRSQSYFPAERRIMQRILSKWLGEPPTGAVIGRETGAGLATFLTMSYIIFVQPAVLSGAMFNMETGLDFGAVTTATCLSAALASAIMGIYARYPIAQAPGMGENFFFVFSVLPAAALLPAVKSGATQAWQVALGVVLISGLLFLLVSVLGVRAALVDAISPSMKNAIAVGIGLFIAFIGFQNAGLIQKDPGTALKLNPHFASPDLIVFSFGLLLTAVLRVRGRRGAILWGILGSTVLALLLRAVVPILPETIRNGALVKDSMLMTRFAPSGTVVALPPSLGPTFFRMDVRNALSLTMIPYILVFLFMDVFDTLGTLIGVAEQAGFVKDNRLPRARQVMFSDAVGTVTGAALGTSTVTSFIESAAGVEQGGRTGFTAVTVSFLFLIALFFSPLVRMVGSYAPITAPALVIVGAMMLRNAIRIDWDDFSESIPAFLVLLGIPLSYSIADGLALGFISYPIIKVAGGRSRECRPVMLVVAAMLVLYFVLVRSRLPG